MKVTEILKLIEDHLDKVSVEGEKNWQIMMDCKKSLRELRSALEKADQKKKEEADHGTGKNAIRNGKSEDDAGTV